MSIQSVKAAFQEAIGPTYSCTMALMDMVRAHDVESQILFFRGNDPDGAAFEIKSDPIRAGGDLIAAAQATAQRLLSKGNLPS